MVIDRNGRHFIEMVDTSLNKRVDISLIEMVDIVMIDRNGRQK